MSQEIYVFTLYNRSENENFDLKLHFDGPQGNSTTQSTRRALAKTLCSPADLLSGPLDRTIENAHSLITVMSVEPIVKDPERSLKNIPESLRIFLFRGNKVPLRPVAPRPSGFYIVDSRAPCVLAYICVSDAVKHHHLGRLLFRHYEKWVRTFYPTICSRLYVASLNTERVISFYESVGYSVVDPQPAAGVYNTHDVNNNPFTIQIPVDAVLMRKEYLRKEALKRQFSAITTDIDDVQIIKEETHVVHEKDAREDDDDDDDVNQ